MIAFTKHRALGLGARGLLSLWPLSLGAKTNSVHPPGVFYVARLLQSRAGQTPATCHYHSSPLMRAMQKRETVSPQATASKSVRPLEYSELIAWLAKMLAKHFVEKQATSTLPGPEPAVPLAMKRRKQRRR